MEHQYFLVEMEPLFFFPKVKNINAALFQHIILPDYSYLETLVDHSQEIQKWVNEKRLREAEIRLAQAKSIPNLSLKGGPRILKGSNSEALVFEISMPLPFSDSKQGGKMESEALKEKVIISEEVTRIRLKTALFGLYQEMKHAKTEIDVMKKEIIPEAEKSLNIAQIGYDQGRFTYLDLLDAQRTLLEVYRENIEVAYSFHSFVNATERLLGISLNGSRK